MNRNLIKIATTLAVTASAIGGITGAAQASTTSTDKQASAVTMAGYSYFPYPGNNGDFPTWWGGPTTICVENLGFAPGRADLTGRAGGAKTLYLHSREIECVRDWWGWGTPVNVRNSGYTPLKAWSY